MMSCAICKNTKFKKLYELGSWKIVRCSQCGLVRTEGSQSINYKKYHRDNDYEVLDKYFKNIFLKRYSIISKYKAKGKILDIGASTGNLLSIFKEKGWEVWGIEPSGASKVAEKRGIKIVKSDFEKSLLPKNYFDVVVMNHTLEHVKNPVEVLKKISTVLKKEGIVYIDVPNFGSLSSHLAGKNWKYLLPNEHVHHFTSESLTKCFEISGLKVINVKTWSGIFDVFNPFEKFLYTLLGLKKQFLTDIIELPGNIIATIFNRGTNLVIIGKKST